MKSNQLFRLTLVALAFTGVGLRSSPAHAQSCVPPPSGLIAWYPGDGNTLDYQGDNNGALQGGATYASGKVGQAFSLNGTSSYVEAPDSPALNPTQQLTLDAWAFPTADAGGGDVVAMIINKQRQGWPVTNMKFAAGI